jgi:hypothetical protein
MSIARAAGPGCIISGVCKKKGQVIPGVLCWRMLIDQYTVTSSIAKFTSELKIKIYCQAYGCHVMMA